MTTHTATQATHMVTTKLSFRCYIPCHSVAGSDRDSAYDILLQQVGKGADETT